MAEHQVKLRSMASIVHDLWGVSAPASVPAAAQQPPAPAFPPFEQLWHTADETVDWTEALVHAEPTDGMTVPELWKIYHQYAAAVLKGDVEAYVEVLRLLQPLADLGPYAASFTVTAINADCLRVCVEGLPVYLKGAESQRYQAGMCLRTARDLLALLPVTQVEASMRCGEETLLTVSFHRSEMQRIRFAFVDPVAFVQQCGGTFTPQA